MCVRGGYGGISSETQWQINVNGERTHEIRHHNKETAASREGLSNIFATLWDTTYV